MLTVNIKKIHENAVIPKYAKDGDAGMDLVATSKNSNDLFTEYGSGLSMEIPEGHVGLIFPRSSISIKTMILSNCVGVIDSGYRGEVKARFRTFTYSGESNEYEIGDKFAQIIIMPFPQVQFSEVSELSTTDRGQGGYGSTGL